MPARPKRSEQIKITLTTHQLQQLKLAAEKVKRPPATYAHELLCEGLQNAKLLSDTAKNFNLDRAMGELYGVLDMLTQQLAIQVEQLDQEQETSRIQSLLTEINNRIETVQETLISVPHFGEEQ